MQRLDKLGIVLFLLLGVLSIGMAVRVAQHYQRGGALRIETGRLRITSLTDETRARLDSLSSKVLATYYVSRPERMPSKMRRLERHVSDLLEAMHAYAPGRFDFQVVAPDAEADLSSFAARRRISPMQVREVAHDSWDERKVWSSLSISYGAYPEAILHGIGPEHLPLLQGTVVSWLDQLERPRRARIALAAPRGFQELEDALSERGDVTRVDLDAGDPLPEADLFVWMRPQRISSRQRRSIDRLLESGGSVLFAGGLYTADDRSLVELDGAPALELRESGFPAGELLSHFGLHPLPDLVLDGRNDSLSFGDETLPAPFLIRAIAPHQDFRGWAGQPNGTLLFAAPSAFGFDTNRLRELRYTAQALVSTSDRTWLQDPPLPPGPPLKIADMKPENGRPAAKQAVLVGLKHDDDWRGRIAVCGSDSPFADVLFSREHVAHQRLLRVLLDEMISDQRLVVSGAKIERPEPIPTLSATARLLLRAIVVGLLPLALVALALTRGTFREALGKGEARKAFLRPALKVALAAGCVLGVARVGRALGASLDATAGGWNTLAPEARDIARRSGEDGEVGVELLISESSKLPPELRPGLSRLGRMLRDFARAGAELDVHRLLPEDLDPAELESLREAGMERYQGTTSSDEVTTFRRYDSTLRFSRGPDAVLVPLPDADAFELLEFHIAYALWRLEGHPAPLVLMATDAPRLSAAEDYQNFQQKGLFAPKGSDVYQVALERLSRNGLRVEYVNPREPKVTDFEQLADDVAALVWLQPRRSTRKMIEPTLRYLVDGGNVLLAVQHFNLLQQQFRGNKESGFLPQYWPQPQTPDVDNVYFPEVGIELVREVLFDELAITMDTVSEVVGRGAQRIYERQEISQPTQIRASAANFSDVAIMRNLGDQAFIWGNRLRWDDARLAQLGITATPLLTTSSRAYSYPWKGGFLPGEYLGGEFARSYEKQSEETGRDLEREDVEEIEYLGKLPLGVLFEGPFPAPVNSLDYHSSLEEGEEPDLGDPWPTPRPGKLVFLGCSEFLKNHRVLDEEFRGEELLWNVVAHLALPEELATLATKRSVAPGFGLLSTDEKLRWRSTVIGAPIGAVVLFALVWFLARRASPVRGRASEGGAPA